MDAIRTFKHKTENRILKIFQDSDPISPREWDNLGLFIHENPRYLVIDKNANIEDLAKAQKNGLVLDFCADQLCGQVYATRETILKEYNAKRLGKAIKAKAERVLNGEIETYRQWADGEVYGFIEYKINKCNLDEEHEENINSCWGFFGYDMDQSGMWDHIGNKEEWIEQ